MAPTGTNDRPRLGSPGHRRLPAGPPSVFEPLSLPIDPAVLRRSDQRNRSGKVCRDYIRTPAGGVQLYRQPAASPFLHVARGQVLTAWQENPPRSRPDQHGTGPTTYSIPPILPPPTGHLAGAEWAHPKVYPAGPVRPPVPPTP